MLLGRAVAEDAELRIVGARGDTEGGRSWRPGPKADAEAEEGEAEIKIRPVGSAVLVVVVAIEAVGAAAIISTD